VREEVAAQWLPYESLEYGIIFGGIPPGAISRKVGLIWGIPATTPQAEVAPTPNIDATVEAKVDASMVRITYG
jgi:hypothetical protein